MGSVMGRKRNRANRDKPKGVYKKRGNWIYREYQGVVDGKAKFGPDIPLCPLDAPMSELHRRYEEVTSKEPMGTLSWLLKQYHASAQFDGLAARTQGDYDAYRGLICGYVMGNGRAFGEAPLDRIKRTTIRGYLDKYGAPIAANRHVQYIKAAWNWALERYDWMPENACQGVKLNEQTPRERYVHPDEYRPIHEQTTGWVHWAMELAYLLRARRMEVTQHIKVSGIKDDGLHWRRGKGSDGEITAWTPRLRAAVDGALKHSYGDMTPIGDAPILLNNRGRPISKSAWNSALQRLRPKMDALGIERFTLHDLKAAGYSDQKERYAGHRDKSGKMDKVYNRKLQIVKPAE